VNIRVPFWAKLFIAMLFGGIASRLGWGIANPAGRTIVVLLCVGVTYWVGYRTKNGAK